MPNDHQMMHVDEIFRRFANIKPNVPIRNHLGEDIYSHLIQEARSYCIRKRCLIDPSLGASIAMFILSIEFCFTKPFVSIIFSFLGCVFILPFAGSIQNEPALNGQRLVDKSDTGKDDEVMCRLFLRFAALVFEGQIKCYRRLKRLGRVTYRPIEARHFALEHRWLELLGKERGISTIVPKFWDPGSWQIFVDEDQIRQNLDVAGEFALNQVFSEPASLVRLDDFQRQGLRHIVEKIGCLDDLWDSAFRTAEEYHHVLSECLQKKVALRIVADGLRNASQQNGKSRVPASPSYVDTIVTGKNEALTRRLSLVRSTWLNLKV